MPAHNCNHDCPDVYAGSAAEKSESQDKSKKDTKAGTVAMAAFDVYPESERTLEHCVHVPTLAF